MQKGSFLKAVGSGLMAALLLGVPAAQAASIPDAPVVEQREELVDARIFDGVITDGQDYLGISKHHGVTRFPGISTNLIPVSVPTAKIVSGQPSSRTLVQKLVNSKIPAVKSISDILGSTRRLTGNGISLVQDPMPAVRSSSPNLRAVMGVGKTAIQASNRGHVSNNAIPSGKDILHISSALKAGDTVSLVP